MSEKFSLDNSGVIYIILLQKRQEILNIQKSIQ
jgi:hypothetical protein